MNKDLPEYVEPAKKVKVELNIIGISNKKKLSEEKIKIVEQHTLE